ncbi:MAG: hypothetical protein JSU98_16150 [Gemmatimonadales bacterium]|jgi:hypothetical protein|nr:MAG: hypothetical protein JSU98_16150 [Gemmatimonadales bacterium]
MNAGVDLVQAYLHLNGYFTITELPVIRETRRGYEEVTDLDILAVRFPWAAFTIPGGNPGPEDDLSLALDQALIPANGLVDVIIGEVKAGKARINERLRSRDALLTALRRVGFAPDVQLADGVEDLLRRGRTELSGSDGQARCQVRILAFGEGQSGPRSGYHVLSLKHVAGFVERYLDRYHRVLKPSDLPESALGILHLLRKVR